MPRVTMLEEIDYYKVDSITITEIARKTTLELAGDHEEYRKDGDLVTDIGELSERVLEYAGAEIRDKGLWDDANEDDIVDSIMLGVFEGAREHYVGDRWEIEIDLPYLVAACEAAGVTTPYKGGRSRGY